MDSVSVKLLLFPADRDAYEFFAAFQSNVFHAPSLFQINQVVHWNALREGIFSMWRHDFFALRDVHSQHVFII